jgi:Protein of unknown function (DUF2742)
MTDNSSASQQVSWWDTHVFITELVAQHNDLPIAGTPRWCALDVSDPRKLVALALDGVHHVLRKETAQAARSEASRAIAAATDWPAVAREIQQRNDFYAMRPWLRRQLRQDVAT